ncbi:MAG TPA: hypothetical protein VF281_02130 [Candidatus Saccharimonadales bacterium]
MVDIVMIAQGDSPSIGLLIGIAIAAIVGWGIVRLSKATLREVIDAIVLNS